MTNSTNQTKTLYVYMAHDRVNGKCYFGSTFQGLDKRRKQHLAYAKKNKNKGHFYAALSKRPDKFFWIIVDSIEINIEYTDSRKSKKELRNLEDMWINKYWGQKWLYNIKCVSTGFPPGKQNPNQTLAWRSNVSKKLSGANNPMFNNGHKTSGEKNGMYGTRPWNNPNNKNKTVWASAVEIKQLLENSPDIRGYKSLAKKYNNVYKTSLKETLFCHIYKMIKKEGWNPLKDKDWLKFVKDIV